MGEGRRTVLPLWVVTILTDIFSLMEGMLAYWIETVIECG